MKKKIFSLLLVLSIVLSVFSVMPISVSAATEYTSGYYTYTVSNGVATITGVDESIGGNVVIPSELGGYDVESIDSFAFYRCAEIDSIAIPNSVITIGESAFQSCEGIEVLVIPDSVKEIGQYAFYGCEGLTSVAIGNGVIIVPQYCFSNCTNLARISIGINVKEIGSGAFSSCGNLDTIEWGKNVETIGNYAFNSCLELKNVAFPDTVTHLGEGCFQNCEKIESVYLPDKIKTIERDAFMHCKSLESITIPDSLSNLGRYAFYECDGLMSVEIGCSVPVISQFCFSGCEKLNKVKIGEGVERIEVGAFGNCDSLNIIVWGKKLATIEMSAFQRCNSLTSIIIPDTVTLIEEYAFQYCEGMEMLAIPDSVEKIGQYAFYGCDNLSSLYLSKEVDIIGQYAFCTCKNLLDLYYSGYKEDWNNLEINSGNESILNATIHYNTSMPNNPSEPSDPAFKDDGIAVLTTEKSFSVKTGESFWLAFGMIDGESGKLKGDWKKMSIVVSDPSVVSLSEYKATEYGYSLEVKGKKKGSTNLVVTDTESGDCITILVSVYDEFVKTYSYDINNIASFYPQNKWEDHIATNIYDLNGIYINNYFCYQNGSKYVVSFDAYNHRYHTGAVDIYDANGEWINSVAIEKYNDIASIWDTGEQLFYLISNVSKYIPGGEESNLLTYEQESVAKHTKIEPFEVPEGGYFIISNNIKESPGAYLFNTSELLFDATVSVVDLSIKGVEPSDFAKLVMGELTESPSLRKTFIETFGDTAVKEISGFAKNYMKNGLEDGCTGLVNDYEDLLNSLDVDWKHLASSATGVAESVFTKYAGPAGAILDVYFTAMGGSNKIHQVKHMAESIDEAYVTVYSNIDSGMINPHGVYIDTNGNIDMETVLQVFRISNDDTIEMVLDSDNPLEKYELYNISFIKNDEQVQPNGKVKVHIPIPAGMKGDNCNIYRKESDGSWTVLDAYVEGNYLVFETDHFSLYAVVGDVADVTIASLPTTITYSLNDTLDTKGLSLKVNGEIISDGFICSPSVLSSYGTQTITVKYGEVSIEFDVIVYEEPVFTYLLGDANGDGKVNVKDATQIQKAVAGLLVLNETEELAADADQNGKVNIKDATAIQKWVAGIETRFFIGEPIKKQ